SRSMAVCTWMRLICVNGELVVCICLIVAILTTSQTMISRHLAYLRRAQIVAALREGKWMHYRLTEPPDEHAARIFREVCASLSEHPELQRDRQTLLKICCAPQLPVQLRRAPRPATLAA